MMRDELAKRIGEILEQQAMIGATHKDIIRWKLKEIMALVTPKQLGNSEKEKPQPSKFTFQAYLKYLNDLEPKSDFALWKAVDLARFVRTEQWNFLMRETLMCWLSRQEE